MSVDLPAPFSPIRAWIWPRAMVKLTLFNAVVPGKSFVMFRISMMLSTAAPPPVTHEGKMTGAHL